MYSDGYKTLSHISLIEYVSKNYKELNQNQIQLIDKLRKFRHGIVYYGKKVSEGFLANHETEIRTIIAVLNKIVSNKLKKERNWFRTLQILNIQ
ncbi:hypothetical protein J4461_01560 [Candidatus Pacearchaeota archaeon]|nr:hypothetical protein [Candidatus Pacearchaeota archaeon]